MLKLGLLGGKDSADTSSALVPTNMVKAGGDVTAGGPDAAGGFTAVPTLGGYVGYQHFWSPCLASHLGCGFAHAALPPGMPPLVSRVTQNIWLNSIFEVTPEFLVGLEYHYGTQEVASGAFGDNHRLQFTLSFGK